MINYAFKTLKFLPRCLGFQVSSSVRMYLQGASCRRKTFHKVCPSNRCGDLDLFLRQISTERQSDADWMTEANEAAFLPSVLLSLPHTLDLP